MLDFEAQSNGTMHQINENKYHRAIYGIISCCTFANQTISHVMMLYPTKITGSIKQMDYNVFYFDFR